MSFRRTVYLWHRYLGIALGLLLAMWFASGIVMMYVAYPSVTDKERIAGLPPLEPGDYREPSEILAAYPQVQDVRLNAAADQPAYVIETPQGTQRLDATTGEPAPPSQEALRGAAERHVDAAVVANMDRRNVDQWTVTARFDPHRPLVRARLDDDAGTWVYLSSTTGEVVQAATRWERGWNWVGSAVHWIYPWQLRQHPELWRQVVIWICIPALILIGTGVTVGLWRLRVRRRYKGNRMTPYRGWHRWHHVLGIGCSLFVFTFMLSGLFSMNPAGVFNSSSATADPGEAWADGPPLSAGAAEPAAWLKAFDDVRELRWVRRAGIPLIAVHTGDGMYLRHAHGGPATFDADALMDRAEGLLPDATIKSVARLEDYDAYYYGRHSPRPLPVLRVTFDDAAATALYINPETGALESHVDHPARWQRWLYNGLHSLDMQFLWQRRPLWDIVVLTLVLAGLAFSMTGVVIAWRRLVTRGRSRRP